jgi:hypothetical protein
MAVGDQRHTAAILLLRERPGTYCIGGWVDPRPSGAKGLGSTEPLTEMSTRNAFWG